MFPVDVVTKLAFSIQEADDLFAFLEALRLSNNLGPFQHLLQLGLTHDHSDLWPSLRLSSSTLDGASISSYEAIIKYYSSVIVEDDWHDVEWLKTHLNPEASIEWRVNRLSDKIDHLNAWTDLRITSLRLQINDYIDLGWKVVLPQLHQLTTLHVDATQGDLGDLYEIVAKSSQIIEFKAFTNGLYQVDEKDVHNSIKWFRRQPVRVFEAEVSEWGNLNVNLRQTMYEVMFNCPTLDRLRIVEDSSYDGIDFTKFTFPMQSSRLQSSHLTSDIVRSFSCQLEKSRLNFLELIDYKDQNVDGAECLLRVLPLPQIGVNWLHRLKIVDWKVCYLALKLFLQHSLKA
ncbi:hypothetical protein AeNC1_017951 [Aphanomyces euteiches]|nr:hypothetical protein AeNC1_017951 [Aphanomyces euteiches]